MSTPREARQFVLHELAAQCSHAIETAQLLVSELVTNATLHAGTDRVEVRVLVRDGRALLAVFDSSSEHPVLRQVDSSTVGGRGLLLVERLAEQWGIDAAGDGKNVWIELTCGKHDG